MDEQRKKKLIENFEYTFRRLKATVAGWKNEYATIITKSPGFYHASWEEIEYAALSDGIIHNAWLGTHFTAVNGV